MTTRTNLSTRPTVTPTIFFITIPLGITEAVVSSGPSFNYIIFTDPLNNPTNPPDGWRLRLFFPSGGTYRFTTVGANGVMSFEFIAGLAGSGSWIMTGHS